MRYSIVIPTYNHLEDCLKPCLESIYANTDCDYEIIVVANGCTDGTEGYVRSLGGPTKLIRFDRPLGYITSTNIGIQQCQGDFILLFNNDNIILPYCEKNTWLQWMERPGAITGVSKLWYDPDKMDTVPQVGIRGGWFVMFFCTMMERSAFDKVGLLDEAFNPGTGDDIDWCLRAQQCGYQIVAVPEDKTADHPTYFPIMHKVSMTFNNMPETKDRFQRGMKIVTDRYNSGYYDMKVQ